MDKVTRWECLSSEMKYQGYRSIERRKYRLPNGHIDDFDIVVEGDGVTVLAITEDQQVIISYQYRPGTDEFYYELPGGGLEGGMTSLEAAQAELLEETGYTGNFYPVGLVPKGAWSTHRTHIFLATNCRKVQEPKLEPVEFMELSFVPLDVYRNELGTGRFANVGEAYLALSHYDRLQTSAQSPKMA